jgi:hypothetical protein
VTIFLHPWQGTPSVRTRAIVAHGTIEVCVEVTFRERLDCRLGLVKGARWEDALPIYMDTPRWRKGIGGKALFEIRRQTGFDDWDDLDAEAIGVVLLGELDAALAAAKGAA